MSGRQNPDPRALPPGWIAQFDPNYNTWFYVNTRANPPTSSWIHPLDVQTQRPSNQYGSQYGAPSGPPPPTSHTSGYDQGPQRNPWAPSGPTSPSSGWSNSNPNQSSPWAQQQSWSDGRSSSQQPSGWGGYGQPSSYGSPPQAGAGARYPSQGWGSASPPSVYQQSQPQPSYGGFNQPPADANRLYGGGTSQSAQPSSRRPGGMGMAVAAGVGGLAAGALIENAVEDHDRREYEEGYEQGAANQYNQDNFGDGGGDW